MESNKNKKNTTNSVLPIRNNNSWARSNKKKADSFGEHLGKVFKPFKRRITQENEQEIYNALLSPNKLILSMNNISSGEIQEIFCSRKASANDFLTDIILTKTAEERNKINYFYIQWQHQV